MSTVAQSAFCSDSLSPIAVARAQMIEQIMAMAGWASNDPARYRRILESYDYSTLQRTWQQMRDSLDETFSALAAHTCGDSPSVTVPQPAHALSLIEA